MGACRISATPEPSSGRRISPVSAATSIPHGTHVCGTIGARPVDPATQRSGIAPGATLFSAKVSPGADTFANQGDIVLAIDALSRGHRVDLINLSLGASQPSEIEHDAIVDALQRGTLCICAAGNTGGGMEWPGDSRKPWA